MTTPLQAEIDEITARHAEDLPWAASRLEQAFALLPDAQAAEVNAFARTLEHVLLAHMADPQALRAAVQRLPGDRLEATAAGRIAAALDLFADPEATLPATLPPEPP